MSAVYVYAIGIDQDSGIEGPVKVGISKHPAYRLATLQTGSHQPLMVVGMFRMPTRELAAEVERNFHVWGNSKQLMGEWFDIQPSNALAVLCGLVSETLNEWGEKVDYAAWLNAYLSTGAVAIEQRLIDFGYYDDEHGNRPSVWKGDE